MTTKTQDPNVLFLKAAVKLGELEKADAKGCMKELAEGGEAGKLAVKRGYMSMSARMRVQTRVEKHLRKASKTEAKTKTEAKAKAPRTTKKAKPSAPPPLPTEEPAVALSEPKARPRTARRLGKTGAVRPALSESRPGGGLRTAVASVLLLGVGLLGGGAAALAAKGQLVSQLMSLLN